MNARNAQNRDSTVDYGKRKFLGIAGVAATLGPVLVAEKVLAPAPTETGQLASAISRAIGPVRLDAEPEEILQEFISARPGVLIPYYQLFWPVHRTEGALSKLTELSQQALTSGKFKGAEYRLKALPAIAHVHALGSPRLDERGEHENFVLQVLRTALDETSKSDRLVSSVGTLELIWRTMIAALIRNKDSWTTFLIGPQLLDQGTLIVEEYLSGREYLFSPATLAWQFLLTYERATRARLYDQPHTEVASAIGIVRRLSQSKHYWWFSQLETILRYRSSLEGMLPQASEVFMGYTAGRNSRFINDYFMAAHLQRVYLNSLLLPGSESSDVRGRAEIIEKASLPVLAAYGVLPNDWQRMRKLCQHGAAGLSKGAIDYWDKKMSGYRDAFSSAAQRDAEMAQASALSQWVPFRERDEESISRRTWGSINQTIKAFAIFGMRGLWLQTIISEASAFGRTHSLKFKEDDIRDRAEEIIETKADKYSNAADAILEEVKLPSGKTVGWTGNQPKPSTNPDSPGVQSHSRVPGERGTPLAEEMPMPTQDGRLDYKPFSSMFPDWKYAVAPPLTDDDRRFHDRVKQAAQRWQDKNEKLITALAKSSHNGQRKDRHHRARSAAIAEMLGAKLIKKD